jgi:hypothetical protein
MLEKCGAPRLDLYDSVSNPHCLETGCVDAITRASSSLVGLEITSEYLVRSVHFGRMAAEPENAATVSSRRNAVKSHLGLELDNQPLHSPGTASCPRRYDRAFVGSDRWKLCWCRWLLQCCLRSSGPGCTWRANKRSCGDSFLLIRISDLGVLCTDRMWIDAALLLSTNHS